jgi:SAM-dependent methyltransferase
MTQLETKSLSSSHTAAMEKAIPMTSRRIGSWEVLISRWPLSTTDLASRYDAVSGRWVRTARRFQLKAAYREPLLTSQVVIGLMQIGPQARILDCGVGNGSLSIAPDRIMKGPVDFHAIDTSAEMLVQAKSMMHHAGLRPHFQQADVMLLPYDDQSFDVVMAAHVLEHLPDPQRALAEMIRVLKPGGMVFVCVTRPSLFGALANFCGAHGPSQNNRALHGCISPSLSMSDTNRCGSVPLLASRARPFGHACPSNPQPVERFPMIRLRKSEWVLFGLIFVYSFIPAFGGLIRVLELAGGPQIAPANPRALLAPTPIIFHILSSFVFCIVGAVQFLPSIRRQRPATHRKIGRVIAVAGCVSALTGLWMTHFYVFPEALQGAALYWVRMVLGMVMVGLIIWAIVAVRARKIFQHSAAMVRAYAIGQGASTQAVVGIAWIIAVGSEAMGPLRDGLMIFAWALNLLAAEIFIRSMLSPPKHRRT